MKGQKAVLHGTMRMQSAKFRPLEIPQDKGAGFFNHGKNAKVQGPRWGVEGAGDEKRLKRWINQLHSLQLIWTLIPRHELQRKYV